MVRCIDNDGDKLSLDVCGDDTVLIGIRSNNKLNLFSLSEVNDFDRIIGVLIEQREILNKRKEGNTNEEC